MILPFGHIRRVGRQDSGYLDKLNHACIVDGTRLSFGTAQRYNHGDLDALEAMLRSQGSGGALARVEGGGGGGVAPAGRGARPGQGGYARRGGGGAGRAK